MEPFLQRYIYSWRFNGWFFHDMVLGIVLSIGMLLIWFLIIKCSRVVTAIILLIAFFSASNFAMFIFGLAGLSHSGGISYLYG